jgi:uncharacterized membrane protein
MERVNRSKNSQYIRTVVGLALLTAIVFVVQFIAATIKLGTFSITFALMPIVIGAALYGVAAGAWLGLVFGIVVLLSGDAAPFLAVNAPATILVVLLKGMLAGVAASCIYKLFAEKESTGKITIIVSGSLLALGGGFLVARGILQSTGKYEPMAFSLRDPNISPDSSNPVNLHSVLIPAGVIIALGALIFAAGLFLVLYLLIKKPGLGVSPAVFLSAAVCPIVNTGIFLIGCRLFFFDTIKEWAGGSNAFSFMIVGMVGLNFILEFAINMILVPAIVVIVRYVQKGKNKA